MPQNPGKLDFAYKYPFSGESKEIVARQGNDISLKYLEMAGKQIGIATDSGLDYNEISINSIKLDYVMAYLYSRMLLSALKRMDLIRLYAIAEAKRSTHALLMSDTGEMINVASQLGIKLTGTFDKLRDRNGIEELSISFIDYVKNAPRIPSFDLVNQRLSGGTILLNKNSMAKVIENAIAKEIMKGLPIKSSGLPRQVIDYSKGLKFRAAIKIEHTKGARTEEWIERLLQTPIADVRHRTVNLILAPYFVNSKGYDVEQATKMISDYIEKCKQVDPGTKINEGYIRYQCSYAKKRGLRPLSFERAKELLGSQVELEQLQVKQG